MVARPDTSQLHRLPWLAVRQDARRRVSTLVGAGNGAVLAHGRQ